MKPERLWRYHYRHFYPDFGKGTELFQVEEIDIRIQGQVGILVVGCQCVQLNIEYSCNRFTPPINMKVQG